MKIQPLPESMLYALWKKGSKVCRDPTDGHKQGRPYLCLTPCGEVREEQIAGGAVPVVHPRCLTHARAWGQGSSLKPGCIVT